MGLNCIVPCIACGVNTSNPHCFCSDECWDGYHDRDLYDADVLAAMHPDEDEIFEANEFFEDDDMTEAEMDEFASHMWEDDGRFDESDCPW